jgi:hypothetical protein
MDLQRQQIRRLIALGHDARPIEDLYTATGTELEQVLEDLLSAPFCPLAVSRITKQRRGEADLRIVLSDGQCGIAQINAKDDPTHSVSLTKACAVLGQSPELSPRAFICIGRPDFDKDAISKARQHAANGTNYKALPVSVIAEMYVRFTEGRMSPEQVANVLENATGYVTVDTL